MFAFIVSLEMNRSFSHLQAVRNARIRSGPGITSPSSVFSCCGVSAGFAERQFLRNTHWWSFSMALDFSLSFMSFGLSFQTPIYLLFFSSLVAVIFIDLSHQIIPDVITLPGIVIGVLAASTILPPGLLNSLIGLLLGGGLFYLVAVLSLAILKKEGMGGGDIKLIAMIGAFLGWQAVLLTIFLAALSGSIVGVSMILMKGRNRADLIPFGPYLALGAMTTLFWGRGILTWYFSLGRP